MQTSQPLLSLITPTHNPQYLLETYRSLVAQDYTNWEWLLLPNGSVPPFAEIPAEIQADVRARVLPAVCQSEPAIGALKRLCAEQAHGEMLIELDHDDRLAPGILTEIAEACEQGADFVYSDMAYHLDDADESPYWFSARSGWESYAAEVYDRQRIVMRCFELTPRSLANIYYAPDHVRCWRKSFYHEIGGHDVSMALGDDHDLVCRSYIAGGKFVHIPRCGYLYRLHNWNSFRRFNDQVQQQQWRNCARYLHSMITRWLRDQQLPMLGLIPTTWGPSLLPLRPANSVGCIKLYQQSLQTVPVFAAKDFLNQCYTMLVPGGYLVVDFALPVPEARGWRPEVFAKDSMPGVLWDVVYQQEYTYTADTGEQHKRYRLDLCALKLQRAPGYAPRY